MAISAVCSEETNWTRLNHKMRSLNVQDAVAVLGIRSLWFEICLWGVRYGEHCACVLLTSDEELTRVWFSCLEGFGFHDPAETKQQQISLGEITQSGVFTL